MSKSFSVIPQNWGFLKELLQEPFTTIDNILNFLIVSSGNPNFLLKGFEQMSPHEVILRFNFIRIHSLRIQEIFPDYHVPILEGSQSFTLTREQLLILLCHMSLLTFKPSARHVYWVTFENWLTDGRPCALAYLRGLFSYFEQAEKRIGTDWKSETVTFNRRRYSNDLFPLPEVELRPANLHLSGSIGDYSQKIVDFANQHIGFGIGGTQEEIIFGTFIELCPCMIFCCKAMEADEAIIIQNVYKYSSYSGYGFSLKYTEPQVGIDQILQSYDVIAMDALDLSCDYQQSLQLQLKSTNLERELRKLLAGFSFFNNKIIDTGHWGCGAFGGNKCVKGLLQMIAATITGNTLSYCCFSDEPFYNSCKRSLTKLTGCSLMDIWYTLSSIDHSRTDFTFDDFIKYE